MNKRLRIKHSLLDIKYFGILNVILGLMEQKFRIY